MDTAVETTSIISVGAVRSLGKKRLVGVEALVSLVELFRASVVEGVQYTPANLKVFRTFQWCLPKAQKALTEEWHEAAMRQYIRGPAKSLTDKSAVVDTKAKNGGSVSASSSSSTAPCMSIVKSTATATVTTHDIVSNKDAKNKAEEATGKDCSVNVMGFFKRSK